MTPAQPVSPLAGDDEAPRYLRLAKTFAERIKSGELPPGDSLPPERKIAELFGVSRVTVRRALDRLASDGLIDQRQGSGTYVAQRLQQPLSVLTSFTEDVRARGMTPSSAALDRSIGLAAPEEAIGLCLKPGQPVARIVRLRQADGMPLAIENSAVVIDALPEPERLTGSLYDALAAGGMRPVRAIQRLSAVALDERTAKLLAVAPGSPGLYTIRVGYVADGRPVEYTRSYYRGDRWDFVAELS